MMAEITPERFHRLLAHCRTLLNLAERWLEPSLKARDEDHLAFMAITFAAKQRLHFESMGVLASAGCYADLATIARVMLDGLTVLKWSAHQPDERPLAWRAYSLVLDYKLLQQKRTRGDPVDESHEQEVMRRLDEHGHRFLKRGSSVGTREYRTRWYVGDDGKQITLEQMMQAIGADPLYDLYDEWSGWLHWNARGVGQGIHRGEQQVSLAWNTENAGAAPLAVGFQALVETLAFLEGHLHLQRRAELDAVVNAYLTDLRSPQAAA